MKCQCIGVCWLEGRRHSRLSYHHEGHTGLEGTYGQCILQWAGRPVELLSRVISQWLPQWCEYTLFYFRVSWRGKGTWLSRNCWPRVRTTRRWERAKRKVEWNLWMEWSLQLLNHYNCLPENLQNGVESLIVLLTRLSGKHDRVNLSLNCIRSVIPMKKNTLKQ